MAENSRLLIVSEHDQVLERTIARLLPDVPYEFVGPASVGPWPEARALLLASLSFGPPGLGGKVPRLQFVQSLFTGLDVFPFDDFPSPILVAGNVGAYAPFVAESAVALLLALAHDLREGHQMVQRGELRPAPSNRFVAGRTVLLLGYGEIAHHVARLLRPYGVRFEAVTRDGAPQEGLERVYASNDLAAAVREGDLIVESRPLTSATRGSLNGTVFSQAREEGILVNVGRAGTIDEESLYRHLAAHPRFRFGTDVFWEEDFPRGVVRTRFPFFDLPNFLATPHNAALGAQAHERATRLAVENLGRFFRGSPPLHVVDRSEYRPAPSI